MRTRRFGNTDLTVSEVGFGCAGIGGVFQGSSRIETLALLQRAFDAGITFFDTADMYTQGESERLLADAFLGKRDRVVIATKFGFRLPARKQLISRIKPLVKPFISRLGLKSGQIHAGLRGTVSQQDFSAAYIASAVEGSLRRLKTDYIDLYQLHSPPPEVLERGEFVEPLEKLRQQGKVRYWGVACERPDDMLASLQYASLSSVQVGFSVLEQAALDTAIPNAAERGVAVIARQAFASGLLTRPVGVLQPGQLDADPLVARRKHDQIIAYVSVAERCGRNRAEMALRFALAGDNVSVVLLGMSRQEQLAANLRALQSPTLTEDEHRLLTAIRRPGR